MPDQQDSSQIIIRPYFNVWCDFAKDSKLLPSGFELGVKLQMWYKREATADYICASYRTLGRMFDMNEKAIRIGSKNIEKLGYIRIEHNGNRKSTFHMLPKLTEAIVPESMYYEESRKKDWVLHNKQLQTLYARLYISRPTFKKLIRTYTSLPENVWQKCLKDTLAFQKRLESGQEESKCSSKRISVIKYLETCLKNANSTPIVPSSAQINAVINRKVDGNYELSGLANDLNDGVTVFAHQFVLESTIERLSNQNYIEPYDTGWKARNGMKFWIESGEIKAAPEDWYIRHIVPKINKRSENVRELSGKVHELINKQGERYDKNIASVKGR